ncbi:hypothetical protein vBVpaPMGD2_48 [Vibrio phage vB_VpaP_MGD2]|uniref:Uncharacterized protein n=1 Tax=Vibrio phage vB_VpaP_MGD2 TaxID=2565877 RepID=A0A6B7HXB8_9CAUD|nr:hypothetical protein vBVpaPMGD2_48 [Vibrio phage vB_VpaP_MGD2]
MKNWTMQDITNATNIGTIELESGNYFEVFQTQDALVFGNFSNTGLIQSGYMQLDSYLSLDDNLQELVQELETYYQDGKGFTTDLVTNDRM